MLNVYILSKSEAQLKDALHKTTKQFVEWCLEHDVSHVVMGNPDGVQRHTKKKGKRQNNQKFIQLVIWKSVFSIRKYKLEAKGITY